MSLESIFWDHQLRQVDQFWHRAQWTFPFLILLPEDHRYHRVNPGQLFTGSGQVAPPRPPVPSRAPGLLLAFGVARGRSRSPSRGTVSTASRVSVTRPESPPPGNWHNGGIWQPPQYSAAPHLPFSVWPLENQNSRAGVVEKVSGNRIDLRAWLRSCQDVQYPFKHFQTHENYPEDVSPKRYYILSFFFAKVHTGPDSSGPGPFHTRSTAHSIGPCYNRRRVDWDHSKWCNCTLTGASSPLHSFFCLGSKRTGHIQWDRSELSRLIHQAWNSTKNTARIMILALGWGSAEAVRSGGELACIARTLNGGAVHHKSGRLWVVHTDSHFLQGLAFKTDAVDPAAAFWLWLWVLLFLCVFLEQWDVPRWTVPLLCRRLPNFCCDGKTPVAAHSQLVVAHMFLFRTWPVASLVSFFK